VSLAEEAHSPPERDGLDAEPDGLDVGVEGLAVEDVARSPPQYARGLHVSDALCLHKLIIVWDDHGAVEVDSAPSTFTIGHDVESILDPGVKRNGEQGRR
jgi:hypothetical protein